MRRSFSGSDTAESKLEMREQLETLYNNWQELATICAGTGWRVTISVNCGMVGVFLQFTGHRHGQVDTCLSGFSLSPHFTDPHTLLYELRKL